MRITRVAAALLCANLALLPGLLFLDRAAVAQAVAPVLRARAIELVDGRGQVRAQLDVESSGEVVLLDEASLAATRWRREPAPR